MNRILSALPASDLSNFMIVLISALTVSAIVISGNATPQSSAFLNWFVKCAVIVLLILLVILILKTRLEYRRRASDPSLAFIFQSMFEKLEENGSRKDAAQVCIRYLELESQKDAEHKWEDFNQSECEKVEAVLDWLEDLGFYLKGDQLSEEVLHHAFYHWISGWYSVLESYIDYTHQIKKEDAAYVHIAELFGRTSLLEKQFEHPRLRLGTKEEKLQFLKSEGGDSSNA